MADRMRRRHLLLGIPVVVLTTLVGTSAFASLSKAHGDSITFLGVDPDVVLLVVGTISVLAAVLSSLQTFLRYATRAEGHRIAALRYETLRRDMATTLALPRAALDAALDGTPSGSLPPELREQLPLARAVARARPGRYVVVPQRPPPDQFDVMQRFVASVASVELRRNLQRALGGHAPFRRFREVLADDVLEEERWEGYGETVRQIEAREWLEGLDIEPIG